MKDFFSTLFKMNLANVGKVAVGLAAGVLAIAATGGLALPPVLVAISSGVVATASVLGVHAVHLAEPPKKPGQIG